MRKIILTVCSNRIAVSLPALILLLCQPLPGANAARRDQSTGVSAARYARLARGVNMGEWLRERYQPRYGVGDLKLVRALGFTYVRLPVGSKLLFDAAQPTTLDADNLKHLDTIVTTILGQGLAVDICVVDDAARVWYDTDYAAKYADFWRALARHLAATDPERVFLEVVNEPDADTAELWNAIQPQLLAAMREGAPQNTLIANANMRIAPDHRDNIGGLERLQTVPDPNVIYNIQFFEPLTFTHQGATWGWSLLKYLRDLPYPSSPAIIEPLVDGIDVSAQPDVIAYGRAAWDRKKIDRLFRRVADWGQEHGVSVLCDEIGVYRAATPADSRQRWLADVRQTLEKYRIGWALWDYDGGFGLVNTQGERRVVDEGAAHALGLNVHAGGDPAVAYVAKFVTPSGLDPGPPHPPAARR